ncbi:MAG: NAD-binding protein [Candidatus Micrarchaeota archaeon]
MGKVVIFGAGNVGKTLLEILEARKHKLTIVDESREVCNKLASEKSISVIHGDATDPSLLDDLDLQDMDYVFCVSGSDESNFLSGVYSKQAGAKKVICRVKSLKHSRLLEKLGIDSVVSELTLAAELANRASSPTIHKMLNPAESKMELVEKIVDKGMHNKSIAELTRDKKTLAIAIYDGKKFIIAKPTERPKQGSVIVILRERGFLNL